LLEADARWLACVPFSHTRRPVGSRFEDMASKKRDFSWSFQSFLANVFQKTLAKNDLKMTLETLPWRSLTLELSSFSVTETEAQFSR